MVYTGTIVEAGAAMAAAITPSVGSRTSVVDIGEGRRLAAERALDEVLADSFPASDPPSWNAGIVRPSPARGLERGAEPSETIAAAARAVPIDIVDVSRPKNSDRTLLQGLVSLAGAAGIALLAPYVLVALIVLLVGRSVLRPIARLFGVSEADAVPERP